MHASLRPSLIRCPWCMTALAATLRKCFCGLECVDDVDEFSFLGELILLKLQWDTDSTRTETQTQTLASVRTSEFQSLRKQMNPLIPYKSRLRRRRSIISNIQPENCLCRHTQSVEATKHTAGRAAGDQASRARLCWRWANLINSIQGTALLDEPG